MDNLDGNCDFALECGRLAVYCKSSESNSELFSCPAGKVQHDGVWVTHPRMEQGSLWDTACPGTFLPCSTSTLTLTCDAQAVHVAPGGCRQLQTLKCNNSHMWRVGGTSILVVLLGVLLRLMLCKWRMS